MKLSDIIYTFDKRLNNPVWLMEQLYIPYLPFEIAQMVGCSEELINKKISNLGLFGCKDSIFNTHTGFFHYTKRFIAPLLRPYIKKISQGIDTVYDRIASRNSIIFKKILEEMEEKDKDRGDSTFSEFNITRKQEYILAMKFMICLYEYDSYYIERMEYILKRVMEENNNISVNNKIADPENWYPNRNGMEFTKFIVGRMK